MILSIVIPIYNEEKTLRALIEKVMSVGLQPKVQKEIILVNDGSTDGTLDILKSFEAYPVIKIIHHQQNQGKTSALISGMNQATGEIILIQDADLEYNPDYYPGLIEPIIENKSLVVYGSRFKGEIRGMTLTNRLANIFSNLTFNLFFGKKLSDINTC